MLQYQITNLEIYPPERIEGEGKKVVVYPDMPILLACPFRPPQGIDFVDAGFPDGAEYLAPEIVFGPVFLEPERVFSFAENLTRFIHNHALYVLTALREVKGTNLYTLFAVKDRDMTSKQFLQFIFDGKKLEWDARYWERRHET